MCSKLKLNHVNHIVYTLIPYSVMETMENDVMGMKMDNAKYLTHELMRHTLTLLILINVTYEMERISKSVTFF